MMHRDTIDPNIRSDSYYIAQASMTCAACGRPTRVAAIAMPSYHHMLLDDESPGAQLQHGNSWEVAQFPAWLFYIGELPAAAHRRLLAAAPGYAAVRAAEDDDRVWMNHCEHCGEWVDEPGLYCEPGGAFMPMSIDDAAAIRVELIDEPILLAALGYSTERELFAWMAKR